MGTRRTGTRGGAAWNFGLVRAVLSRWHAWGSTGGYPRREREVQVVRLRLRFPGIGVRTNPPVTVQAIPNQVESEPDQRRILMV